MESELEEPTTFREGVAGVMRHVRPYRRLTTLLIILGLISAIANGVVPYVTGRFFDALIALSQGGGTVGLWGLPVWGLLLGAWALIQIISNATDWVDDRQRRALASRIQMSIQAEGFIHLFQLPLAYHANEPMQAVMAKLSIASWRTGSVVQTIVNITPQLLSVLIGITLAATISAPLAGVLAFGVFVYVLLLTRMLRPAAKVGDLVQKAWNDSWNDAAAAVNQVTSVKQAAAEAHEIEKTRSQLIGHALTLWRHMELLWSNVGGFQRAIVFLTQLMVFILSVDMVANVTLTIGELVALNGYAL